MEMIASYDVTAFSNNGVRFFFYLLNVVFLLPGKNFNLGSM